MLTGNLFSVPAQSLNQKAFDEKSQTEIIVGYCNTEGLLGTDFAFDYNTEFNNYSADTAIIEKLRNLSFSEFKCVLVLATWCGDSKEQVPRFLKIMKLTGLSFGLFSMICVDREKVAPGMDVKSEFQIERVPTWIFYKNDTEIGRIIETPQESIEKDMYRILVDK